VTTPRTNTIPAPATEPPVDREPRAMPTASREIVISNALGLHARPAMQFVDLANQFQSAIVVRKGGDDPLEVDGKSVMQMITLEAIQGTRLSIEADGSDADRAVEELAALVEGKFGEED
jgi:phosphotransferase system HPr (HPr) family protein